jgi:hypothetical protein
MRDASEMELQAAQIAFERLGAAPNAGRALPDISA